MTYIVPTIPILLYHNNPPVTAVMMVSVKGCVVTVVTSSLDHYIQFRNLWTATGIRFELIS